MSDESLAAFTRRAANVVSRRGAFRALSSAALTLGLADPRPTAAKKGKKCKKPPKVPPCPGEQRRLANGTCATVCAGENDCAPICLCGSIPSTDGPRLCAAAITDCPDVPQTCDDTRDCPVGQFCDNLNVCGKRCVPVCG
jgi:hypothetical protein